MVMVAPGQFVLLGQSEKLFLILELMLLSNCSLNSTYTENYFSSSVQSEKKNHTMHFLMKMLSFSLLFLQGSHAILIPVLTSGACNSITS